MSEKSVDDHGPQSHSRWSKVEHYMLLATFMCALVGTVYSVRTARRALEQSKNNLRPWITISSVNTHFKQTQMVTNSEIKNVGNVPAYIRVTCDGFLQSQKIRHKNLERQNIVAVIFPGQTIWRAGFQIEGKLYQQIVAGEEIPQLQQRIHISYGTSVDKMPYFTSQKLEFQPQKLPRPLADIKRLGLWRIVTADFK